MSQIALALKIILRLSSLVRSIGRKARNDWGTISKTHFNGLTKEMRAREAIELLRIL